MLNVYTAQYRYKGEGRTDITVKTATEPWKIFAPTWPMVKAYMNSDKGAVAESIYTIEYEKIMVKAFNEYNDELMRLINSDLKRVFVCFCKSGAFCHRVLLAKHFTSLGAIYHGEIK